MSRKEKLSITILGLGACLAGATFVRYSSIRVSASNGGTPFTASVVTKLYDGNGKLGTTKITLDAMKADGSFARAVQTVNDRAAGGLRFVTDTASKTHVAVDPLSKSRTTYHWGVREAAAERDPSGGCSLTALLRPEARL